MKKNYYGLISGACIIWKSKLLKRMKIVTLLILVTITQAFALDSYAQNKRLSLRFTNERIINILDEIEEQSEFYFMFDASKIDVNQRKSIDCENQTITNILDQLFENTRITYRVSDRQIGLISTNFANADQSQAVSGKVSDSSGSPLPGVTVVIKGTTQGTVTNGDGEYSLSNIPDNAELVFSFVGMKTQEITVAGKANINVVMAEEAIGLDEVVAVGYGTQTKASLTGSAQVVKMDDIEKRGISTGNIVKAIEGFVPGLQISYNGNPNNTTSMILRGRGTLNSGIAPLIIIDGVPTNRGLNELAVHDIENIQVLKDASSATIYGSRAANGVILVTTKKGEEGNNITINSSIKVGFLPQNTIPLLNTEEYGRAQWIAAKNDGVDPNYGTYSYLDHQDASGKWILDEIILPDFLDADKTMKPANTNWEKVISRNAITQNHNIAASFGGKKANALLSYDYLKSEGTTKYNNWIRNTLRINSSYNLIGGRLEVGENISLIKMMYTGSSYLDRIPTIQSIVPVHTIDGKGWGGPVKGMSDRNNPLLMIMNNRQNHSDDLRLVGSLYMDLELFKNFHFKSTAGVDYDGKWQRTMNLKYNAGFMSEDVTKMEVYASYDGSWTWNNVFNYQFKLNKNNFNLMVGQELTEANGSYLWGARDGFAMESTDYMYLDVGEENVRNGNIAWDNALNSYFGRLVYDYSRKYLLTAIIRRDGSSRFGTNNKYALFPSLSAGWVITEESFMESFNWLSYLKIRYGWGRTGNQEIDNYASYSQYMAQYDDSTTGINPSNSTAYDIYGNDEGFLPSGFRILLNGNSDLKWETTTQNNFGVDFNLFDSKLTGSFDYYIKHTYDILVKPPTLRVTGYNQSTWYNGAEMKNKGWEATLSYSGQINKLSYFVGFTGYHNDNEFVYIMPEALGAYAGNGKDQTILGRPLRSLYGYIAEGIFQNQEEVDAAPVQPGKGVGRIKYRDISGSNGVPDGKIDSDDRTWIGVDEPKFAWSSNLQAKWKNFTLSMLWNSEIGREISSPTKGLTNFFGFYGGQNYGKALLNAWTTDNNKSDIPALTKSDNNSEQRFSTYFVENTSYLKLQSFELGYELPKAIAQKLLMQDAQVFVQGENLWTIKLPGNSFTGYDEKNPNLTYPLPISFTFGLNFKF
ncbi:SusC/RagA family TonB-linked outer membrane protein [Mariniphaga sediminis]|uniref:SusC/RagA family TonB-linked outer membrane protein n=1 Tax=Mariniphaga sediminis TaxID=1628158 RepID=A0A399CTN5_9BACT|nr:TonB-dependent receptor [Mariniphaga sediminis]RIH63119.1 SusC/RagA family TonB-linked outer membrane protein [Mariniphaga sediminis]